MNQIRESLTKYFNEAFEGAQHGTEGVTTAWL